MRSPIQWAGRPRVVLASVALLIVALTAFASGQIAGSKPASRHFDYVHQEVVTNSLTQTMNELDGQGWEVFQVVPVWQIKNDDGETTLSPKAYQVFGRRVVSPR